MVRFILRGCRVSAQINHAEDTVGIDVGVKSNTLNGQIFDAPKPLKAVKTKAGSFLQ